MKKGKIIAALVVSASILTGCVDHMPNMTDEQTALVAEYAADALLKHSSNYQYRLVDEELLQETEEVEETSTQAETEEEQSEALESEAEVAQTESETTTQTEEATQPEVLSTQDADFAQALGLDGVSIYLDSYEVSDSYPMKEGAGFSVNAAQGNDLLILHFTVKNIGADTVDCVFYEADASVAISINGAGYRNALTTLLTNDFAMYEETIPDGESREVVALLELASNQLEQIDTISVRVSGAADSITAQVE